MVQKTKNGSVRNLKTLRLLVEVIESGDGYSYTVRTENGVPIASSNSMAGFLSDVEVICNGFEDFNPDNHGNEEN